MTLEDAITLTVGRDMWATADGAGAPSARMADGPMGVASGRVDERDVATLSPAPVCLASTWDRDIVTRVGAVIGGDAKRRGVDLLLAPNLNLQRTPTCGRAFELFGEDPFLAGTLGLAWIEGVQSRHVGAVAKHLVCNDSETARDRFSAEVDEAALREIYLLPFEMAAAGGCAGLLTAYNKLNGTHCAEHEQLLQAIVRKEWRYRGFTVSDWFGTVSTARAMNAGLDLEMPGPARFYGEKLAAAVAGGEVAAATVGAAARRIAQAAARWAGGDPGPEPGAREDVLTDAAAAGFVLLRNDGDLLPIPPGSVSSLAVIGPNAFTPCLQGGTFAKVAVRPDATSLMTALAELYGAKAVHGAMGCPPAYRLPAMPTTPVRECGDGKTNGMTVEYFDSHDFGNAPLGGETRNTNSLTWFGGMPGIGSFDHAGGVRASGIFTPSRTGIHRLHVGGTGSVRMLVEANEVLSSKREIAPNDIMGLLKSNDSNTVELLLVAGAPVRVDVELRYFPARAQGLWYGIAEPEDPEALFSEAEKLARNADAVLLVLGESADSGVESKDRETTALPDSQRRLARLVIAANPNVVVAVNVAHAFDPAIADGARALLVIWYPGESFGSALASVLAGEREPTGRLPLTIATEETDYPAFSSTPDDDGRVFYLEGSGVGHRGFTKHDVRPSYPFGAGLGYGKLHFKAAHGLRQADGGAELIVTVSNAAGRPTAAVVQVYREDGALAGFAKAKVAGATTLDVVVNVPAIALRRWKDGDWRMPSSTILLRVGSDSGNLPLDVQINFHPQEPANQNSGQKGDHQCDFRHS